MVKNTTEKNAEPVSQKITNLTKADYPREHCAHSLKEAMEGKDRDCSRLLNECIQKYKDDLRFEDLTEVIQSLIEDSRLNENDYQLKNSEKSLKRMQCIKNAMQAFSVLYEKLPDSDKVRVFEALNYNLEQIQSLNKSPIEEDFGIWTLYVSNVPEESVLTQTFGKNYALFKSESDKAIQTLTDKIEKDRKAEEIKRESSALIIMDHIDNNIFSDGDIEKIQKEIYGLDSERLEKINDRLQTKINEEGKSWWQILHDRTNNLKRIQRFVIEVKNQQPLNNTQNQNLNRQELSQQQKHIP